MLGAALVLLLTAAQWNADIDFLGTELPKRHPNPFAHTSREAFNAQLEALKAQTGSLSDSEIAIRLQQAVASLRDGHTELAVPVGDYFPIRFHAFPDGIYVTKTAGPACGARLVAIDGVAAHEVYARVATTISAENDQWLKARVPDAMTRADVLRAVGVPGNVFTFESVPGNPFDVTLTAGPAGFAQTFDKTTADLPFYRQHPELRYWHRWLPEQRLLYVKYNVCANDPANPFANLEAEVLRIIDTEAVEQLVIDVRDNSGGSTEIARSLINSIAARPRLRGRVFAIVGRRTYSSALLNAIDLQKAGAMLVGEPTGGKPNAYGEVRSFVLPSSRLTLFHSTRLFTVVPGDPPWLEPELHVEVTATDFFRRRDPVLAAITGLRAEATVSSRRRSVGVGPVCPQ